MRLMLLASALALTGCASPTPAFSTHKPFDPADVAWFNTLGSNSIRGSALLRQQGGGIVTCAGTQVVIFPTSAYTFQRMTYLYGSPAGGYNALGLFAKNAGPAPAEYEAASRKTTCDAQGFFTFKDLPDGIYHVVTAVAWQVGYTSQGGALMKQVEVRGGQNVEIVLNGDS